MILRRLFILFLTVILLVNQHLVWAQLSPVAHPPVQSSMAPLVQMRGVQFDSTSPFNIAFIIDSGVDAQAHVPTSQEVDTLIKYFFTALTLPDEKLWVNLSPQEQDRIVDPVFG